MKSYLYIAITVFLFTSCVKNNPDPSWLEVNPWVLTTNPNSNFPVGELTQNFTDVKVIVDEKIIGIFEAPFKIPLLMEGAKVIRLYPVVKNNGIAATKKVYPFVEPYEITVDLEKNKTVTVNPTTRYYANVEFWIEDFEDAIVSVQNDPNYPGTLNLENDAAIRQSFNGNFFGRVNLDANTNRWVGVTNAFQNLPLGEVYLEIDYYNTNSVITGLVAHNPESNTNHINVQLNAQDASTIKWKKIYIDLKELVIGSPNAVSFDVSFDAILDEGKSSGQLNFDNIKLVHF